MEVAFEEVRQILNFMTEQGNRPQSSLDDFKEMANVLMRQYVEAPAPGQEHHNSEDTQRLVELNCQVRSLTQQFGMGFIENYAAIKQEAETYDERIVKVRETFKPLLD